MESKLTWTVQTAKVSDLINWEKNPRKITEEAFGKLKERITKRGFHDVIKTDGHNTILSGNQRKRALTELNIEEVNIMVPSRDLTDEEKDAVSIESNRNDGMWDNDMLANQFDIEFLFDMGFTEKELGFGYPVDEKDDEVPDVPEEPKSKLGDIYKLGEHRVMCGDSTNKDNVARLMDGKEADMVFTDPPYSVNYEKKNKDVLKSKSYSKIEGDDLKVEDIARDLWKPVFDNLAEVSKDTASIYVTMPQGGDQMMMMMMMMMDSWQVKHELIWVKNSPVFSMGRLDYDYMHEPILYGWKKTHQFYGGGEFKKSVWAIKRDGNKSHPTMKPVELIMNAIANSSKQGDLIIDMFLGSGSTLIASEKTGRTCYGMELDPKYIDVIIKRWEEYTGKKAIKL